MPTKNNKSNAKYTAPADSSSSTDGDKKGKNIGVRVKVRHVMCAKQSKILEALAKLDEGTSFAEVAKTYSEDKAKSGGDLGWMVRGSMAPEFEAAAFSAALNKYTQPVKTQHGYHIILVEEKK